MAAISAGHQMTLNAASEILRSGGNAVDAAIAAYWMSFVSEPCMASAGAGGFAQIYVNGKLSNLDFFCQTPIHRRAPEELHFYPIEVDFGVQKEIFHVGRGASATPGAIAGLYTMHKHWATMDMKELASQAIAAAKQGVALDKFQAEDIELLKPIFAEHPQGRAIAFKDSNLKQEGDLVIMPQYADFLDAIAHEGQELFYLGEIASMITNDYQADGLLTTEDLSSYKTNLTKPYSFPFGNYRIHTTRLPSAGGVIIAAILKGIEDSNITYDSSSYGDLMIDLCKSIKQQSKDINAFAKDLTQTYGLTSPSAQTPYSGSANKGTSHFSIADDSGNAVALTTSIGEGNGYFIPGTDMQMNNMLGEAALLPNGFHSWQPNTRLTSMMCPTMVTSKEGDLSLVLGSGGAGRIPYAIAQTIAYHLKFDLTLLAAIKSPRVFFDDKTLHYEAGLPSSAMINPNKRWDKPSLYFGGTNAIGINQGRMEAVADHRRYGISKSD